MQLNSIRIVLVETSHPGNIGATARAMKTMGLTRLYLVNPRSFPDVQAHAMAAGADDVLHQAQVVPSLEQALAECHVVFATSARSRDLDLPGLTPAASAEQMRALPNGSEIAIVFGREQSGLTNQELLHCHYHIHIPTVSAFSSLNLAQAVQIVAYEIRMRTLLPTAQTSNRSESPALVDDVERFYVHLDAVLVAIGFLNPAHPKRLRERLRRLFNRAQLEGMEVNILRGILTSIQSALALIEAPAREKRID